MLVAKVTNGAVVEVADYRKVFSNTSFSKGPTDQFITDNGCMKVSAFVDHDRATQRIQRCDPYIQNGVVYTVEAVDKTADEIAAEVAKKAAAQRKRRDALLAETDYMALSDVTMSAAMTTYRQALRDITTHANWPDLASADMDGNGGDWPTKP